MYGDCAFLSQRGCGFCGLIQSVFRVAVVPHSSEFQGFLMSAPYKTFSAAIHHMENEPHFAVEHLVRIQTRGNTRFISSSADSRPRFITEKCSVIKMLNILTNIPNSATQILKLLWVVYGHTYANFMKISLLAYTRKAGTSECKLISAWRKKRIFGGKKTKLADFEYLHLEKICLHHESFFKRVIM